MIVVNLDVMMAKRKIATLSCPLLPPKILDSSTKRNPLLGRLSIITLQKGWL